MCFSRLIWDAVLLVFNIISMFIFWIPKINLPKVYTGSAFSHIMVFIKLNDDEVLFVSNQIPFMSRMRCVTFLFKLFIYNIMKILVLKMHEVFAK